MNCSASLHKEKYKERSAIVMIEMKELSPCSLYIKCNIPRVHMQGSNARVLHKMCPFLFFQKPLRTPMLLLSHVHSRSTPPTWSLSQLSCSQVNSKLPCKHPSNLIPSRAQCPSRNVQCSSSSARHQTGNLIFMCWLHEKIIMLSQGPQCSREEY